jgi:hypothetical protein
MLTYACRVGGGQEESAFDHDKDMSDTDACISDHEYLGQPCDSFDDTDGGHLPHVHFHNRYNYLPMTEDMAEHVRYQIASERSSDSTDSLVPQPGTAFARLCRMLNPWSKV